MLGYDIHGKPWTWADETRVMQALVLGQTGSGKTTLLRNIITQDLMRRSGPPQSKIPMVIFDGKGDLEFFESLLPYIQRAGRMADLRLLNPSRPELSVQYNPFCTDDDNYGAQVSMIFGSFDLRDEFFAQAPTEVPGRHRPHPALHRQAVQLLRRDGHGAQIRE